MNRDQIKKNTRTFNLMNGFNVSKSKSKGGHCFVNQAM